MPMLPPVTLLAPVNQLVSTPARANVASEKVTSRKRSVMAPRSRPAAAVASAAVRMQTAIGSSEALQIAPAT